MKISRLPRKFIRIRMCGFEMVTDLPLLFAVAAFAYMALRVWALREKNKARAVAALTLLLVVNIIVRLCI